MQLRRWLKNEAIDVDLYYLPFIKAILHGLGTQTLVFIIDGSTTSGGCVTLMVSVLYKGRSIPVVWLTRKGKKGHFPESLHVELIKTLPALIPLGADVICLGDGEFDGTEWLTVLKNFGWRYVCRTAKNSVFFEGDDRFQCHEVCPLRGGKLVFIEGLEFTEQRNATVNLVACWDRKYVDPIFWATNFETGEEAHLWYRKRFRIETLFSDMKSRGFNLHKSRLREPKRVSRLIIAAAIAYIWVVFLGEYALQQGWEKLIHRTDRCDWSLFKLGKHLLKRLLRENHKIPPFSIGVFSFN
jgi:hypothetical protein